MLVNVLKGTFGCEGWKSGVEFIMMLSNISNVVWIDSEFEIRMVG